MQNFELGVEAHESLSVLGRRNGETYTLDTLLELGRSRELSTDGVSDPDKQNLKCLKQAGLAQKRPDIDRPIGWVYSLTPVGHDFYDSVDGYDVDDVPLDSLVSSVSGTEALSGFIVGIDSGYSRGEIAEALDVNPNTVTRYTEEADDLGILNKGNYFTLEITEQGREVQEFVREIGEIMEDHVEEDEDEPIWM